MLSTIAIELDKLAKSIKTQREILDIHWDAKVKAKIANNIKRFQGRYTVLSVELDALKHDNTLKSNDITARAFGVSHNELSKNGELNVSEGFHKVKHIRKPFDQIVLEYETKAKSIDMTNFYGPESLALALTGKHFNEMNNKHEREAIQIVFYTVKQNFIQLERVMKQRDNRLMKKQLNRHKYQS